MAAMFKLRLLTAQRGVEVLAMLWEHIDGDWWAIPAEVAKNGLNGHSRLVVSKILNHVESDITTVYDRHSYDAEKRQALVRWAGKLETILGGGRESAKLVRIA